MISNVKKIRYEPFGGIIFSEKLVATVFVDKDHMESLGYRECEIWKKKQDYLSAPLYVHFNLTNRCPKQCKYCYADSIPKAEDKLSFPEIKKIIDVLADLKVFSIAYGGGEPFSRKDIFEIAKYTRQKGIVPNITTNGIYIDERNVELCKIFGHIQLSIDLLEENISVENRRWYKIILLLKKAGINVGLNYILTKESYKCLEDICHYANKCGVREIMFLRLKPFGRGKAFYNDNKLSNEQNISFFPTIKKLSKKYQIKPIVECSFLPIIYHHRPNIETLKFFGFEGCRGGNYFVEIDYQGFVKSCSFCEDYAGEARELKYLWDNSSHFKLFRNWNKNSPFPCSRCDYLETCKGGCHSIAKALTGNFLNPDPECPFVQNIGI